ncbi:MAG: hypothetical protein FJ104_14180 [Deltaproteobacteria bacterium]|nr:hypothetical protein [Deltaproteobacteria bacterium]
MRLPPLLATLPLLGLALACTDDDGGAAAGSDGGGTEPAECSRWEVREGDACVDPARRGEPEGPGDANNVVAYEGEPLTLDLPPPPKSGFRLVVPPRRLAPGEEVQGCVSWAYPELAHRNVHAARLYTSGGLHHSNMYGVALAEGGPSPYPGCAPDQDSVFAQIGKIASGVVMDVLFANSTQIEDGEQVLFPEGMAFAITTEAREVATSIHWLNTTDEEIVSEVVYDFFTIPDDAVKTPLVPFVFDNRAIDVPAGRTEPVSAECQVNPAANIVSFMPHSHQRVTSFDVELVREDGTTEPVYHDGRFDAESEITVYDEPISLEGFRWIRHTCVIQNDLDQPIIHGVGNNEMCTLFGYLYPPTAQQLGYVPGVGQDCLFLDIGTFRK